jgi:carboxypeptidase Q
MLGLGRSDGTGGEILEAEVLAVADWDELTARRDEVPGKIVLFDPPWENYGANVQYRAHAASRAAEHGAVAALIRPAGFGQNTPHTGVMRYNDQQPRIPAASLTAEGAALLHRLADAGVRPRVQLAMDAENLPDGPCANVIGELRGREKPEEIILLAGHLDAWDTGGGAHDDGGGCVIMVAALKVLHDLDLRPRRTVRVVLYTSEEYGGQGGRAYREAHADEVAQHVLALESDAGSFAPAGFSVRADSTAIGALAPYVAPLAAVGADSVYAGWAGVDIGPLVEAGVLGVGHRVHGAPYMGVHHSPADVFEAVDPDELAANVAAVAGFVYGVANSPDDLPQPKDD